MMMRDTGPIRFSKLSIAIRRGLLAALILPAYSWAGDPAEADAQATPPAANSQSGDRASASEESNRPSLLETVQVIGYRTSAATSATGVVTEIINTPISISAINSQFLEDTGSSQIMEVIGSLTGVTGQSNSGETMTNFAVRGFQITPQVDGFDSLSYVGGLGSTVGVDRIEVIKGPSAVFNGNVPPGGEINIIYKKPSFNSSTYAQGEVGSWSYRSGELFSTGPIVADKLAYLVDLYAKNADGWVDWTGQKERTAILGLTYRPIDGLSINANYRYSDHKDQFSTLPVSYPGFIGSGAPPSADLTTWVAQNIGPNVPPQQITVQQYLPGGSRYNVLGPQNFNNERSKFWSTETSYTVNDHVQIRDNFAHVDYNWNFLTMFLSGALVIGPDGRVSTSPFSSGVERAIQEGSGWENKLETALYFDTGPISHSMLVGYQVSYSRLDLFQGWLGPSPVGAGGQPWSFFTDGPIKLQDEFNAVLQFFPTPNVLNMKDTGHQNTRAYYVAEQMSMFDDRLHALLGVRYTKTENEILPGRQFASSATTPQIGILGKPFSPDSFWANTAFFANYSKSFTPNGFVQPGTEQALPPQKGTGKEIGVKTAWLNGAVTSTVSFFRDDLSNIATADYSHADGSIISYNLGGVGRAQGWEAEVTWLPTANLQLSANFTDLPVAKYLDFPGTPQEIGRRFGSTPRQAGNLTAKYTFAGGLLDGVYLGGWIHAQSETRGVLGGDWHYDVRIPGLTQASAFVGYATGHFDVHANIDNLTNRSGFVMNNAFLPQSPRSYLLTVKYSL
ncbi:MAG: TonB-dependent receptor plug domain-containing protein [Proteobacteria bacterium]|nr:TonB-dependent receptor plug domain-containing protein [Pseudomonadota bacterium]